MVSKTIQGRRSIGNNQTTGFKDGKLLFISPGWFVVVHGLPLKRVTRRFELDRRSEAWRVLLLQLLLHIGGVSTEKHNFLFRIASYTTVGEVGILFRKK